MSTTYAGLAPVQVDLDQQRADLLELPRYQSPFTVTAAYESKQEPQQKTAYTPSLQEQGLHVLPDAAEDQNRREIDASQQEPEGIDSWLRYEETEDYRNHATWSTASQNGWAGRCKWLGYKIADGMDAAGGFLANLFGITSSRYQWVLDARERMEREAQQALDAELERVERGEAGLPGAEDSAGLYRDDDVTAAQPTYAISPTSPSTTSPSITSPTTESCDKSAGDKPRSSEAEADTEEQNTSPLVEEEL